jgi:membrane protein DedA with SNARE-associated domain
MQYPFEAGFFQGFFIILLPDRSQLLKKSAVHKYIQIRNVMEQIFDGIITTMLSQGTVVLYIFLFASAVVENLFPPIPGDTVTALGAFLVGNGTLSFVGVYSVTTLGSVIGFMILFELSRAFGHTIISKGYLKWISPESIESSKKTINRFGYVAIIANRLLPGIRSVISISAGLLKMKRVPVALFSLLSAAIWNLALIALGYSLGSNWELVKTRIASIALRYNIIAGSLLLVIIAAIIIYRRRKTRNG